MKFGSNVTLNVIRLITLSLVWKWKSGSGSGGGRACVCLLKVDGWLGYLASVLIDELEECDAKAKKIK